MGRPEEKKPARPRKKPAARKPRKKPAKPKKKPGRPPKLIQKTLLNDENLDETYGSRIIAALNAGTFFDDACSYAGISKSAGYEWLARGKAAREEQAEKGEQHELPGDERVYAEFADAVEKARAGAVVANLAVIRTAAQKGNWQAAAWFLERTKPEKYGRFQRPAGGSDPDEVTTEAARAELAGLDLGDG